MSRVIICRFRPTNRAFSRSFSVGRSLLRSVKPPFFSHNCERPKRLDGAINTPRTPLRQIASSKQYLDTHRNPAEQSFTQLIKLYAQLSKMRLSIPIVLSAMSGVALSPLPTTLPTLLATAAGTALCSASANALNQLQEVPFDAQMVRTRTRPLVRRAITPFHAMSFALTTGIAGPLLLWTAVNPVTAALGAGNIALYAGVYTWLKRKGVSNTWVGAVVGAVPPLMGWTAGGGHLFPTADHPIQFFLPFTTLPSAPVDLAMMDNALAPMAFFMLLFSWQFPHFNALSHIVRGSYAQAGYRMLSSLSPSHNALVALRHAMLLVPVCSMLIPLSGLTTWTFALTTLAPNAIFVRATWRFWRRRSEESARNVFQHSLWYLPAILALMMVHKQGVGLLEWMWAKDPVAEEGQTAAQTSSAPYVGVD